MLSLSLTNKAAVSVETPADHFNRPYNDEEIAGMDADTAVRFRATIEAAADKAYQLGRTEGKDEAEEATTKAMQCDFEQGLTDVVFNIVTEDQEAALRALGSLSSTFGSWRQFKTLEAKAKKPTEPADGGSQHVE